MRGWNVFLINILCLEVSEGTRGFEYVKNCVDNPYLKKLSNYLGEGREGWFFFFFFVLRVSGVQKEGSVLNIIEFRILN
jgi:hypothetical protein